MDSLPILNKSYELYKDFVDLESHLGKRWHYSLGMSAESSILQLIEDLVMAKNAPKTLKGTYLIRASAHLEVLILKFRLLLELKLTNETRLFQLQAKASEIGRMLGGWLKSLQSV